MALSTSKKDVARAMYVAEPAMIFPLDPVGVSTSSKAMVPTINTLLSAIFYSLFWYPISSM